MSANNINELQDTPYAGPHYCTFCNSSDAVSGGSVINLRVGNSPLHASYLFLCHNCEFPTNAHALNFFWNIFVGDILEPDDECQRCHSPNITRSYNVTLSVGRLAETAKIHTCNLCRFKDYEGDCFEGTCLDYVADKIEQSISNTYAVSDTDYQFVLVGHSKVDDTENITIENEGKCKK